MLPKPGIPSAATTQLLYEYGHLSRRLILPIKRPEDRREVYAGWPKIRVLLEGLPELELGRHIMLVLPRQEAFHVVRLADVVVVVGRILWVQALRDLHAVKGVPRLPR